MQIHPWIRNTLAVFCTAVLASGALADTQYVGSGTCGGLSPCNATIQDAVDAATVPADIRILPGTYADPVDLSSLNADMQGDIVLQAINPDDTAAVDTATITGSFTAALDGDFSGNIELRGLSFETSDQGVFLGTQSGDVSLFNVSVTGVGTEFEELSVSLNGTSSFTAQDVTTTGSNADGISLTVEEGASVYTVEMERVTSSNNSSSGFALATTLLPEDEAVVNLTMTDITANENGGDGIFATSTAGNMMLSNITANGNGDEGIDLEDALNVTLNQITANGNDGRGIEVDAEIMLTASNIVVQNNGEEGMLIEGATQDLDGVINILGDVMVTSIQTTGNADGIVFENASANNTLVIRSATIAGNTRAGIFIDGNSDSDAVVDATGNFWGNASGPTHPGNPGGTGDVVADAANPIDDATGIVLYSNFISGSTAIPLLGLPGLVLLMLVLATLAIRRLHQPAR
ncbi:MAG: right-handed parallel beta-helix repeat-containing protein [Pseudomonadota bacterium]